MQTKIVDKAYSFRIIPNKEQKELINKNIGCVRFVFNHFLARSKNDKYLSYSKFATQLPKLKKEYNWLREVTGKIQNVTIRKSKAGKYYISICVQEEIKELPQNNKAIGIDLGLKDFLITSNGEIVSNSRTLSKYKNKIARLNKRLAKKEEGSNNWYKVKNKLAKVHEKIANIRKDFLHKLSTKLIRENQTIIVESLKVKNMLKNSRLAKSIFDVSWSKFVDYLSYKAEWYGRELIKIDTFFHSSQLCSECGYQNKKVKDLSVREWECPKCHSIHDRDINASKNILQQGLQLQLASR